MRDKVVDKIMYKIKEKNLHLNDIKYKEIRYGLQGLYTLVTKTTVIFLLAFLLNIFNDFIIFFIFYSLLRSVSFGTHAKSNLSCWIFSTMFLIGIPWIFKNLTFTFITEMLLWSLFFINFIFFAPADTKKRPMINKKRKLKFKLISLIICIIYLVLIIKFKSISNLILAGMFMEALLINPIGYIIMGEEIRFRLNDLNIFKLN